MTKWQWIFSHFPYINIVISTSCLGEDTRHNLPSRMSQTNWRSVMSRAQDSSQEHLHNPVQLIITMLRHLSFQQLFQTRPTGTIDANNPLTVQYQCWTKHLTLALRCNVIIWNIIYEDKVDLVTASSPLLSSLSSITTISVWNVVIDKIGLEIPIATDNTLPRLINSRIITFICIAKKMFPNTMYRYTKT